MIFHIQPNKHTVWEPICLIDCSITGRFYSKTCVKRLLSKRPKIGFQDRLSLNAGKKYWRMLQGEYSAILLTFIKLPFVIKTFVLSIFGGCFTQVLLYVEIKLKKCRLCKHAKSKLPSMQSAADFLPFMTYHLLIVYGSLF